MISVKIVRRPASVSGLFRESHEFSHGPAFFSLPESCNEREFVLYGSLYYKRLGGNLALVVATLEQTADWAGLPSRAADEHCQAAFFSHLLNF